MADTPTEIENPTSDDFGYLAEFVVKAYEDRKKRRHKIEEKWDEIDRQVAMEAKPSNLDEVTGRAKEGTEWMPFVEQPLQAQTLEVLVADAMRFMFPEGEGYFSAHADVDEDFLSGFTPGDLFGGTPPDEDIPVNQDGIDTLVEAIHYSVQSAYDYRAIWSRLITDCFKRGTFAAKYKVVTRERFDHQTSKVVTRREKFPMLIPMEMRNVYLADELDVLQYGDTMVGKSPIHVYERNIHDLKLEADKASDSKGWRSGSLSDLEGLEGDLVKVLEYEGDIIAPRGEGQPPMQLMNATFTVVIAASAKSEGKEKIQRVVRYAVNDLDRSSFITGEYAAEDTRSPYLTSPLVKGSPIQKGASEGFNRFMQAAILDTEPPIAYNRNSGSYSATKGPKIAPRELIPTIGDIQVLKIGDVAALSTAYFQLVELYEGLTGVNKPRLGGQTKSHQTRFAVAQEAERGSSRIINYVRGLMRGAMRYALEIEWEMIRRNWRGEKRIYVPKWKIHVNVTKSMLPERVFYEVSGAAEPAKEQEQLQRKIQALQLALQVDAVRKQAGEPGMDLGAFQRFLLVEGGFNDVDEFFADEPAGALPDNATQFAGQSLISGPGGVPQA